MREIKLNFLRDGKIVLEEGITSTHSVSNITFGKAWSTETFFYQIPESVEPNCVPIVQISGDDSCASQCSLQRFRRDFRRPR